MKTAISLPDDLFADAERLSRRLKMPRSRVYSEAVREYVARHDPDEVTAKLDVVLGKIRPARDPFLTRAARQALERVEW
jgi:metal-responsive CopG/Arc/MetJ family transcriptional regulator